MLETLVADAHQHRKHVTVYTTDGDADLTAQFENRGVTVEKRQLPDGGPEPFVTIHDDGEFIGALRLADLEELLAPPVVRPGSREDVSAGYRALFELLENTVFSSLDRRQLLGASREIEDRAFRVGHGTLRASFQSFSVFEAQTEVYRHLATETALDIHVYGEDDWSPPDIEGITYHPSTAESVDRFWVVAFDGGGEEMQACALVARQESEDEYAGTWTYDPDTVGEILAELEATDD